MTACFVDINRNVVWNVENEEKKNVCLIYQKKRKREGNNRSTKMYSLHDEVLVLSLETENFVLVCIIMHS